MNFYYLPDHCLFNIHFFIDNIFFFLKNPFLKASKKRFRCIRSKNNNLARVYFDSAWKKLLIIDEQSTDARIYFIHTRRIIYHAKLDMPRNQMVSVPRSTPVLFKVLRFVWANVHEQSRIRLQTFFIWNIVSTTN